MLMPTLVASLRALENLIPIFTAWMSSLCVYVMCCEWKGKGDEILGSCDCPHSLEVNGLKHEATLLLLLFIYLFLYFNFF